MKSAPVPTEQRIRSLDVLRGFALLGILVINMQSFVMPGAAYLNPSAYGDFSGLNKWIWTISYAIGETKFMAIFSVLFGAGIVLVTQKVEERTGKSAGVHYRRNFWLLVFGLIHAHLIWYGDILVGYAICGFFVYIFRKAKPKTLLITGFCLIAVHTLLYLFVNASMPMWAEADMTDSINDWAPGAAMIADEITQITQSWGSQVSHNSKSAIEMETIVMFFYIFWRASGLMLIGMALYKLEILTARRSTSFYKRGWLIGWTLGFPIIFYGIYSNFKMDWTFEYSMFLGGQFNYWGSLGVAFGHICGVMLIIKSGSFHSLRSRLSAVGQMAFTNYIMQSVIGTWIFWAWGLGLFGQIDRAGQLLIILGVWVLQLLWSKPWLDRYRFGPIEWLWRSLTYWQWQPMKKS